MKRSLFVAAAVLSVAVGASCAEAQTLSGGAHYGSYAGHAVLTGRSQVVTTGRVGNMYMYTTTLPSGGGVGFLMNNGNGTSTLVGGGTTMTVPTPR